MFGIGTGELLLIFIVALIVLGPQKLPEIASKLGKAYGTFRRLSTQFQRTLNSEIADLEEEKKRVPTQKESISTPQNDTQTTEEERSIIEKINYGTEEYEDISDNSVKKFVTPPEKESSTTTTILENDKTIEEGRYTEENTNPLTEEDTNSPKISVENMKLSKKISRISQEKNTESINDTKE